jgi:hypothetical protein
VKGDFGRPRDFRSFMVMLPCGFNAAAQRRSFLKKFFNHEMEGFFKNGKS